MNDQQLERYAFFWSEARLLLAAVALFLGGIPFVRVLLPIPAFYGIVSAGLLIAWIISGIVSAYLLYRWWKGGQKLFGQNHLNDKIAFFVNVVSGFNLGIAGLTGQNIGMMIVYSYTVFILAGIVYLLAGLYLLKRWRESNQRLF